MSNSNNLIKWQGREGYWQPKSATWYWLSVVITLFLVLISLWWNNFLFVIFLVIAEVSLILMSQLKPPLRHFSLDLDNFIIDQKVYPLSLFASFAVERHPGLGSFLHFNYHQHFSLDLVIPLPSESAQVAKIKKVLNNDLAEVEPEDSLFEEISRIIGF